MIIGSLKRADRRGLRRRKWVFARNNISLYLMLVPAFLYIFIYKFAPLFGLTIAFKNFSLFNGDGIFAAILNSPWVGFKHFRTVFESRDFLKVLSNTLIISAYKLFLLFPYPVLLALLLNELRVRRFKRTVQTLIYMPHFLSWVVVFGLFFLMLSNDGLVNRLLASMGFEKMQFFLDTRLFRGLLVFSAGWKESGWDTVVYMAAITGISQEMYEAATLDGCGRFEKIWYVTLPSILPVISLMFIMRLGKILNAGYEQVLIMYNPMVYDVADILETYVYRMGIGKMNYSLATAVGLFQSVVAFMLVVSSNSASKKLLGKSIW